MSHSHRFHPTILRSYDIRGQVGSTLSNKDAFFIGAGFGQIIQDKGGRLIGVGQDGRLTSPELSASLIEGLLASGCDVIDIGVGPTPMLYFADRYLECDGAIQVTGSHNPPDYNGFKLVLGHHSFFDTDIMALGALCEKGVELGKKGRLDTVSVFDDYIKRLCVDSDFGSCRIIWDAGNGAAGPAIEALVAAHTGTHKTLFTDIDGHFPNHHPNPVDPSTLGILIAEVKSEGADCAIGFDGDGDRLGVVDSKGRPIAGDILTAYLGLDILSRHPGADIIFDVKSSDTAMELITKAGGRAHLWKTGHSHMKKKLREMKALLGGEMSGHIFIADGYYGYDDALFVATRLISCMNRTYSQTGRTITDFIDELPPRFTTPECHIACPDTQKFAIIDKLIAKMGQQIPENQINLIDGIRITSDKGWCLIRASNTEAAIIARAEGRDQKNLDYFVNLLKSNLELVGLPWKGPS